MMRFRSLTRNEKNFVLDAWTDTLGQNQCKHSTLSQDQHAPWAREIYIVSHTRTEKKKKGCELEHARSLTHFYHPFFISLLPVSKRRAKRMRAMGPSKGNRMHFYVSKHKKGVFAYISSNWDTTCWGSLVELFACNILKWRVVSRFQSAKSFSRKPDIFSAIDETTSGWSCQRRTDSDRRTSSASECIEQQL